jgi:rhodanese-related sulfurtransferase
MWNVASMNNKSAYVWIPLCLTAVVCNAISYAAEENPNETVGPGATNTAERKAAGPYCGLHCLYTIIRSTGRDMKFEELIKPEYIGSYYGSSLDELKKAAEDCGLCAVTAGKLTSKELRQCGHFCILHVKTEVGSEQYDHYELFLGTENGQARLFDPPRPVRLVAFADLAPRWDGAALIVSDEPIDLNAVLAPARNRFILCVGVSIAIVLALHWAKRFLPVTLSDSRIKRVGLSVVQVAGYAIAAVVIGVGYHFTSDEGLLARAGTVASIEEAHQGKFIPKLGEKTVQELLETDTVFVDARLSRDYQAGHLEGAISVPVDSNDTYRRQTTSGIPKDTHIVTYCQSSGCKYAEIVAIKLMTDGFTNIAIYKGGWADWKKKDTNKREASL